MNAGTQRLMLGAFLLSGYAALTWEMSWVRQLVSLFGVTWFAITTILTVFMGGIALGSVIAGRLVDRRGWPPLLVFAVLEAFLAVYGLSFSHLLAGVESIYLAVAVGDLSFWSHAALRFLFGALILLPPTLASGATLPAAAKAFIQADASIGRGMAWLYGANVVGAATGCVVTTFFTIGLFGYPGTAWIGAAANGLAGVLALVAWRMQKAPAPKPRPASAPTVWTTQARVVAVAYFTVGFCSLSGEVLWSRAFSQFGFNPTTYTFGMVLGAFLVGHGLGSLLLFPVLVKRFRAERLFGGMQAVIGVLTLLCVLSLIPRVPMEPMQLLRNVGIILPTQRAWLLIAAVMVPAMLSGALFPLASRLSIKGLDGLGTGVGSLAALSTVGGIAGSFFTGFLFMPLLGAIHCLLVIAGLNLVAAAWSVWALTGMGPKTKALGASAAVAVGVLVSVLLVPNHVHLVLFEGETLVAFGEGRNSSTGITSDPRFGNILLVHGERVKGGGSSVNLTAVLHPEARDAAILGLGTGAVAAEALRLQQLDTVTAVDIDGDLPEFIPWMRGDDMVMFQPPRWSFVENDGRHWLLTTDRKVDILINDAAIYAWYLELSTLEFNRLARSRLEPEGIYAGRLHNLRITEEAFRREVATFLEVFPNAAIWGLSEDICMLIGRNGDLPVDEAPPGHHGGYAATLWYDAEQMRALAAGQTLITDAYPLHIPDTFVPYDELPLLEYAAPGAAPEGEPIGDREQELRHTPGQKRPEAGPSIPAPPYYAPLRRGRVRCRGRTLSRPAPAWSG